MSARLIVISSAASLTAGALIYLSFVLYKRRTTFSSSPAVADRGRYRPVTDVGQYRVYIISSLDGSEQIVEEFVDSVKDVKVVGLDCEWVTREGKRRPVALLQLSSPVRRVCLLFRLDQMGGRLPERACQMLDDRSILKVGVGVVDDANRLRKDYGIATKGCLDLRQLALRHLSRTVRGRSLSLRDLASLVLDYEMVKDGEIRCSDWEAVTLSKDQIDYAAQDAIIGTAIFMRVIAVKLKIDYFGPFLSDHTWKSIASLCQGIVDTNPSIQPGTQKNTSPRKSAKSGNSLRRGAPRKLSPAYKARQTIMYQNCRLLSPGGALLCTCDRKKALWYKERAIGEVVAEEPLTVRLLFEPAGIPGPDGEYYLQEKDNRCCVCGREDSYIRKNVVPHEYRRHFPDYLKKYSSHDVILLCLECHQQSCDHDGLLRQDLAQRHNAPICNGTNALLIEDPVRVRVRSYARALVRNKDSGGIPEARLLELTGALKDFFEVEELEKSHLQQAISLDTKTRNASFVGSHGLKVVEGAAKEDGGLHQFERMWRSHFLEKMQPRFMPALWSVDHKHEASVCKK